MYNRIHTVDITRITFRLSWDELRVRLTHLNIYDDVYAGYTRDVLYNFHYYYHVYETTEYWNRNEVRVSHGPRVLTRRKAFPGNVYIHISHCSLPLSTAGYACKSCVRTLEPHEFARGRIFFFFFYNCIFNVYIWTRRNVIYPIYEVSLKRLISRSLFRRRVVLFFDIWSACVITQGVNNTRFAKTRLTQNN